MRFSVFTAATPEWTPAEVAQLLAAQGWDGVEWRVTDQDDAEEPGYWAGNRATWPLTGLEESIPEILRVTNEAGLDFSAVGGYAQASDHENVERMLAATAALGAGQVRVTLPKLPVGDYRATFAETRADLEWAVERAAAHGVKVLVELHHGTIVSSASAAYRLIEGLDAERIGVIHDIGNLVHEGFEDLGAAFQILGEYLAHVHVKNARWWPNGQGAEGATNWEPSWATLREGQADIDWLFRALAAVGYDGWVTLEDFTDHNRPREERLADNLDYLRGAAERAQMWVTWVAAGSPQGEDYERFVAEQIAAAEAQDAAAGSAADSAE
jgi:sugar phosphate isomerase/epimerase